MTDIVINPRVGMRLPQSGMGGVLLDWKFWKTSRAAPPSKSHTRNFLKVEGNSKEIRKSHKPKFANPILNLKGGHHYVQPKH